ncbi:hypothetical protein [Paenibacillus antarcticus]|nr:hypothetical protein [Paenibacillus antarcticus]
MKQEYIKYNHRIVIWEVNTNEYQMNTSILDDMKIFVPIEAIHAVSFTNKDANHNVVKETCVSKSTLRAQQDKRNNELLKDVAFATPLSLDHHAVIKL